MENIKDLIKEYEEVLRDNPNDINTLRKLISLYEKDKDFIKTKYYYELALKTDKKDPLLHLKFANFLVDYFHDYEKAKDLYIYTIDLDPKNIDAYINLSWLYLEQLNDINTSYIIVQEALKYVENSEIYTQMAYIEFSKYKEYRKVEKNLQKAIKIDKKNDLAYTYLGQLYIVEGKYDNAKTIFKEALSLKNINELLIHEYIRLLIIEDKNFLEAIEVYKKALNIFPNKVIYYAYIANLYFILGNHVEAINYLHMAEEFEIKDQETLLMIGYLKVILDDNKEGALMYFEKVIELNPTNLNALSFIGFYNLINNQQIDTALNYFKKIADLSKDSFIVHYIIAQIYLLYYHEPTEALDYLLKINLERLNHTEKSHILYVIGNIYEKHVGNNHLALDYYEQAYQVEPSTYLEKVISRIYDNDKTIIN